MHYDYKTPDSVCSWLNSSTIKSDWQKLCSMCVLSSPHSKQSALLSLSEVIKVLLKCLVRPVRRLNVCLLNDPGGGTNVPLRACGQMDGRGDSATDTEDWGSSVAAATWPQTSFIHFLSRRSHKPRRSDGQTDLKEGSVLPGVTGFGLTASGLIYTQIFCGLVYL